jgi:hypothetical protein
VSLGGYTADAVPLLAGWFAVAYATQRFLPTWLLGVTLGVAIRMVALHHYHWNQLTFLVVALVFIGGIAAVELRAHALLQRRASRTMST